MAQSGGSDGEREGDHEPEWWCAEAREDSPHSSPASLVRPLGLRLYGCNLFKARDLVPELSFAIKIYYKKKTKTGIVKNAQQKEGRQWRKATKTTEL